ncbi:polysaccharide deacetylase family protein [Bacillus sp. MRMR6]|uniref:polysaccharide deacetylase family protein n=1 Tax=Bacillus sp. MRMR6 TaxID=1928617 RepID=UPI000952D448|nr:polysaccharide deacetylase family protein [Bacillus sp. MRMR6]OLS41006.1 hypothetical protein BTR25_06690 [Bacillus sp. MRMR6]
MFIVKRIIFLLVSITTISACDLNPNDFFPVADSPHKQTELTQKEIESSSFREPYLLEIKGESNQLSKKAWGKMLEWRIQMVDFAKGQENVYSNGPDRKMVALTFDDGPDTLVTAAIIDILEEYEVTGNFFFVGENAEKYPEVVKKAYDKGNLVLSHSYHHIDLAKLEIQEVQKEIEMAEEAIEKIIGQKPAMIRPPFGETNNDVATVAMKNDYQIVLWSIDTLDWSQREAGNIVRNVTENVRNGDIILMHSAAQHSETERALPLMIEELQKRGYQIVGLDTLLNIDAYQ